MIFIIVLYLLKSDLVYDRLQMRSYTNDICGVNINGKWKFYNFRELNNKLDMCCMFVYMYIHRYDDNKILSSLSLNYIHSKIL